MLTKIWKCCAMLVVISTASVWFAFLNIEPTFSMLKPNITERDVGSSTPKQIPTVLCLVLATEREVLEVEAVNKTWTRRCNKTLFIYGSATKSHIQGDKLFVTVQESRSLLPAKVKAAFQFVYEYFKQSFDWYLKADVDTYVIMENLRLLLYTRDPMQSILLGQHLKRHPNKIGFMSGGAGYVLSTRALKDLVVHAIGSAECNRSKGPEDIEIAICLQFVNVTVWSSLDTDWKETFHSNHLRSYLSSPTPKWLRHWTWNTANYGQDCCANFSITFHHLKLQDIYLYEHLLYHTKVNTAPLRQGVFQNATEMTRPKS